MNQRKQRIVRSFDAAADYDRIAGLQQDVAAALARRIGARPLPDGARILEVGCGTGFLAAAMPPLPTGADWLMTDVSAAMVGRSRKRFGTSPGYRFAVLDAEHPRFAQPEDPFDLICSSLAAQWFDDLRATLDGLFALLKPGGRLQISTLADGTFAEWQAAHQAAGAEAGTPFYPDRAGLEALRPGGVAGTLGIEHFTTSYGKGRDFMRSLREIGAGTPRQDHRPLPPATLRAVLRAFEEGGARIGWNVAFLTFIRPGGRA